jgi:hypothetical protein
MYVCTCVICKCVCTYLCTYVCKYVCSYVSTCVCTCVDTCVYVCSAFKFKSVTDTSENNAQCVLILGVTD